MNKTVVWLKEYRTFGLLIATGPFTSTIDFNFNGERVTEEIENDEYEFWDEYNTDYESE